MSSSICGENIFSVLLSETINYRHASFITAVSTQGALHVANKQHELSEALQIPPPSPATSHTTGSSTAFRALGSQQVRHNHNAVESSDPRPSCQIEAMPPFPPFSIPPPHLLQDARVLPIPPPSQVPFRTPIGPMAASYDSAHRHPVFFTERYRKPPFTLPDGGGAGGIFNPVAQGYIFEGSRRPGSTVEGRTKL